MKTSAWEKSVSFISVPPLEGFVMNRVQGDYFETLLYKIFVSIDEHTNVAEVSVAKTFLKGYADNSENGTVIFTFVS